MNKNGSEPIFRTRGQCHWLPVLLSAKAVRSLALSSMATLFRENNHQCIPIQH